MANPDPREDARARITLPPEVMASILRASWFYRALFLLLLLSGVVAGIEMAVLSHKWAVIAATVVMAAVWITAALYATFNTWREWRLVRWLERRR